MRRQLAEFAETCVAEPVAVVHTFPVVGRACTMTISLAAGVVSIAVAWSPAAPPLETLGEDDLEHYRTERGRLAAEFTRRTGIGLIPGPPVGARLGRGR